MIDFPEGLIGDFKVHSEAKRSLSEAFELSIAKEILFDGANIDSDQPLNLVKKV